MNNEFSPVVLWLELSLCCKDIITIVLGVKGAPLRNCHDQGKSQWIPRNGNHDFPSWIADLVRSGGVSPGPSTATNSFQMAWAESRFIARNKQIDR
jgi:hypothetical protein